MSDKIKLVYGFGLNDVKNMSDEKAYVVWHSMIQRCYDLKSLDKYPTYIGCKVCEEWRLFSNFEKWFDEHYRYDLSDAGVVIELDKDLKVSGNKLYSPDTCAFIPRKVNSFLTNTQSTNTSGYTGVCYHKNSGRWVAHINSFDINVRSKKKKYLGIYPTPEEAHEAYVAARKIEAEKCKLYMLGLGYSEFIVNKIK